MWPLQDALACGSAHHRNLAVDNNTSIGIASRDPRWAAADKSGSITRFYRVTINSVAETFAYAVVR